MLPLKYVFMLVLICCAGCLPSPEGGFVPVWYAMGYTPHYPPAIQGTDGSSYETALAVVSRPYHPDYPVTQDEEAWLRRQEAEWIHGKYCKGFGFLPSRLDFQENGMLQHKTERRGPAWNKHAYDVVTLTVPGALTNVTYFDVTRYRSYRRRSP